MNIFLNGRSVACLENETLLDAARREGVYVPTLCEFAALNHRPGTCRMCLVEIEGAAGLVPACRTPVCDGMRVSTRSPRVREARKLQAELLFADHCETCSGCARHGACELQTVAKRVGLDLTGRTSGRLAGKARPSEPDASAPALRFSPDKCIRCFRCVEVCRKVQGVSAITFEGTGVGARVGFDGGLWGDSERCVQCGQCSLVCPTGAIAVRDETDRALDWLADPETVTVFQTAPAVRLTLAEALGDEEPRALEGETVAAIRRLGADFVCDTRWSADVTILEEGTELLERLEAARREGSPESPQTMFTSCCPAWVNHIEKSAPDLIPHLSTTRSPQAIFSALAKTHLARRMGTDPAKMRVVSVMPCTAKKDEAKRAQLARGGVPDTDLVLTVREFALLLEREGIDPRKMVPEPYDSPLMTEASGAAQLFATTGGVMEAALRTVLADDTKAKLPLAFEPVRGLEGVREAAIETERFGLLRVAVVHGLKNVEPLIEAVREGRAPWHFVEVMACPGGCIAGGGTARGAFWGSRTEARQKGVYRIDAALPARASHENADVKTLYAEFLERPGSPLAHELLHTTYEDRKAPAKPRRFAELETQMTLTDKH